MARQKRILLDNALLSWVNAIRYCDQIKAGKITLKVRKNFVSALHNATELFLKQIMLDNCDYRVAEPRNIQSNGEPATAYYASKNLNVFFENVDSKTRMKFVSIDFNRFLDLHRELLSSFLQPGQSFKEALRVLKDLRNNETHFYIGRDEYLTEDEFLKLYNFMVDFYQALHVYDLLPFWGEPREDYQKYGFVRNHLSNFSYKNAVKASSTDQLIAQELDGMLFENYVPLSAYEKATVAAFRLPEFDGDKFDELWAYIESMDQLQMIDIVQIACTEGEYCDPDYGYSERIQEHYTFQLKINML